MKKNRLYALILCVVVAFTICFTLACSKDDRKEITIMSWNLGTKAQNNLNRKMIAEFEKAHPDYKVSVVSYGNYTETLTSLAGKKSLPDVFMLDNLPTALLNEWVMDLSEKVNADDDWKYVINPLKQAVKYNGRTFAIPAEMHMWGLYVNDVVFNENNVSTLDVNPSVNEFFNAVDVINSPTKGVASLNDEIEMINWLPSALDESLGYYTFDGTKFNVNSNAFSETLSKMQSLRSGKKTFASWSAQEKLNTGFNGVDELWYNNGLAMYFDTTANRNAKIYSGNQIAFKGQMRFVGVPSGRSVLIPDMWGISKGTKNFDGAFELVKWLSFSGEGILKRIELDASSDVKQFVSLPISTKQSVIDEYFKNEIAGLKQVFLSSENAIVEPVKTVAGYSACRWSLNTGKTYSYSERVNVDGNETIVAGTRTNATIEQIYDDVFKSQASIVWADVKDELNQLINATYNNANEKISAKYPQKNPAESKRNKGGFSELHKRVRRKLK